MAIAVRSGSYATLGLMNAESNQERRAFKDYFDANAAQQLAAQIGSVMARLDRHRFVADATHELEHKEFAARVQQFADALARHLPPSIPKALGILTSSLPEPLPTCDMITDGWLQWPVGQFIADHGVPHFESSMKAMIELTKRFSSEFAVRPFVEQRPDETFSHLLSLTGDPNPHVRRWCSEGVRPRLPWGKKLRALVDDPSPILPILEALKDDEEPYVRRSVANNLNDIAKDHPQVVLDLCQRWSQRAHEQRSWVIKHGLRTLVKDAHPQALKLIGYAAPQRITSTLRVDRPSLAIGESVELQAELVSASAHAQPLLVDYVVHYVRQADRVGPKVFKWTSIALPARGRIDLRKRHSMKPTTVRKLYPGLHRIELQVNGHRVAEARFTLRDSAPSR